MPEFRDSGSRRATRLTGRATVGVSFALTDLGGALRACRRERLTNLGLLRDIGVGAEGAGVQAFTKGSFRAEDAVSAGGEQSAAVLLQLPVQRGPVDPQRCGGRALVADAAFERRQDPVPLDVGQRGQRRERQRGRGRNIEREPEVARRDLASKSPGSPRAGRRARAPARCRATGSVASPRPSRPRSPRGSCRAAAHGAPGNRAASGSRSSGRWRRGGGSTVTTFSRW
jgi:hypothetical protein